MPHKTWRDNPRIRSTLRSAGYAAAVTSLSFVAALLGSLYQEHIKSAFPFVLGHGPIDPIAIGFWILAVVATIGFWTAQAERNRSREEAEARLIARTEQLERLIQTLPPTEFLEAFADVVVKCQRACTDLEKDESARKGRAALHQVGRFVLFGIANLVRLFEGSPRGTVYAANIMIFRPMTSLSPTELEALKDRLRFTQPDTDLKKLRGVLDLRIELSTSTEDLGDAGPNQDSKLAPLALPVPVAYKTEDGTRWRVLPGAPLAFCLGEASGYTDTKQLSDWCRTDADFAPSVAAAIEAYFAGAAGTNIRSFVSLPLTAQGTPEPPAILNIHSSRPRLLSERESGKQLWPLLEPFREMLLDVVELVKLQES